MQNDSQRLAHLLTAGISHKQKSVDGCTALHRCAEMGNTICAQVLLDAGADIDAYNLVG